MLAGIRENPTVEHLLFVTLTIFRHLRDRCVADRHHVNDRGAWSSHDLVDRRWHPAVRGGAMPKSKHQIPRRVRSADAFMKAHRDQYRVQRICRVLEVAVSG
jgi:hypothetical protein